LTRTLTIRPDLNYAIPPNGWSRSGEAFRDFESSDNRVLIITGSGRAFWSGADVSPDPGDLTAQQTVAKPG